MGWILAERRPKPDRYNALAQTIWDHRHSMTVEKRRNKTPDGHDWTILTISASLRVDIQDATGCVNVLSGGHLEHCGHPGSDWNCPASVIGDAWRAAQAARMLRTIGLSDDIPNDALEVRCRPGDIRIAMYSPSSRYRTNSSYLLLMDRLDEAASAAILEFSPEADATRIAIGDGLFALRNYDQGVLQHEQHGTSSLFGNRFQYPTIAQAFRELRERSLANAMKVAPALPAPAMPALGNARETRMLQLCATAVQKNPMLADASGTLLAPLIATHVPELVKRHREASLHALPQDLARIDDEFSEGMDIVCGAIEEGLAAVRDKAHDDLRTQLSFLRSRHPHAGSGRSAGPALEAA